MQRDARVLTIRIGVDNFGDFVRTKGVWTEDEVWKGLYKKKDEKTRGIDFLNGKIVVWYEWEEGLKKEDVAKKALDWAKGVVGMLLDDAEEVLVEE